MLNVDVHLERDGQPFTFAFETQAVVTGVFGPSGAGKTSLLHLVAGITTPTTGTIRVDDETVFDRAGRIDVATHRRGVGVVFQDDRLFPHLSVPGNLRYGRRHRRHDRAAAPPVPFDEIVRLLDLGPLLERRIDQLSGGERQRVTLGRALIARPRLLLLDEPLSSLDRGSKQTILELIARVRDELGTPMLYVSHDVAEVLRLTDHLLIIADGRSVAHGSFRDVASHAGAWTTLRELGSINVIPATVRGHDRAGGVTSLTITKPGGGSRAASTDDAKAIRPPGASPELLGPPTDQPAGSHVYLSIRPEDVALALARIEGLSIRNQLPGVVRSVTRHPDRAIVEIDIGAPLLVEVSHQTVTQMELAPTRRVWCLIKSNAVRYV